MLYTVIIFNSMFELKILYNDLLYKNKNHLRTSLLLFLTKYQIYMNQFSLWDFFQDSFVFTHPQAMHIQCQEEHETQVLKCI